MVKNNFKKGFSLFEACVVMIIVALFVAVMANVVAHKPKPKARAEAHGRYECYWDGAQLKERLTLEGATGAPVNVSGNSCIFSPGQYAKYVIIHVVGGGAGGSAAGSDNRGGGAGKFVSSFFPSPFQFYELTPGRGGDLETGGGETLVKAGKDAGHIDTIVVKGLGGTYVSSLQNTTVDDIIDCKVVKTNDTPLYNCGAAPKCEIVGEKINVSHCKSASEYVTDSFSYNPMTVTGNPEYTDSDTGFEKYRDTIAQVGDPYIRPAVVGGVTSDDVWQYYDSSIFWRNGNSPLKYFANVLKPSETDKNKIHEKLCSADADGNCQLDNPWYQTLYLLELKLNLPDSTGGARSGFTKYLISMQYDLQDKHPGNGGAAGVKGSDGAIMIEW